METVKKFFMILGSILAAAGALFLFRKSDTPAKVEALENQVRANEAAIASEEAKREEIIKTAEEEKAKDVTPNEVIDFFNNRPK